MRTRNRPLLLLLVAAFFPLLALSARGPAAIPFDSAHEPKPRPGEPYLADPLGGYAKWDQGQTNSSTVNVDNDEMTIETNKTQYFVTPALTDQTVHGDFNYGISPWLKAGDVDLTFDATVENDAGSFALFGGACRFQNQNTFYAFIIQSDGYYSIRRFVNEHSTRLVDVTKASAIKTGQAINHVHIVCLGSHLRLLVNGTLLADFTDAELKSGGVAMVGGAGDNPGTRVTVKNLTVSAPLHDAASDVRAATAPVTASAALLDH